jgi:hypothetical protein
LLARRYAHAVTAEVRERATHCAATMAVGSQVMGTLIAISVAKKLTLYAAGRVYGFPRIYAGIMRATRAAGAGPASRKAVSKSVQKTFRFPNVVLARVTRWRAPGAGIIVGKGKTL